MGFIYCNSGKGYDLLYKSCPKDNQINEFMQGICDFGILPGDRIYTYNVDTDGRLFRVLFGLHAYDNAFDRDCYYKHVQWNDYDRSGFLESEYLDFITGSFASQEDINRLRESGNLSVSEKANFASTVAIPSDMLQATLHTLHSGSKEKIIIALDQPSDNDQFAYGLYARKVLHGVFSCLPVHLRISTSYIIPSTLDSFINSKYRLCVLPSSTLEKNTKEGLNVIRSKENNSFESSNLTEYIKWIVHANQKLRNQFFQYFDDCTKKNEEIDISRLLKCHKDFFSPKERTSKPATSISVKQTSTDISDKHDTMHDKNEQPKPSELSPVLDALAYGPPKYQDVTYNGDIVNNVAHGLGQMIWSDGKRYEGEWLCGKRHGWGVMIINDVEWEAGEWSNNDLIKGIKRKKRSVIGDNRFTLSEVSIGIYRSADGSSYAGDYVNGVGMRSFPNGDWFVGKFENYMRNGWGVYFNRQNGHIESGYWVNNQLNATRK